MITHRRCKQVVCATEITRNANISNLFYLFVQKRDYIEVVVHADSFENSRLIFANVDEGTGKELAPIIRDDAVSQENGLTLLRPCIVNSLTCRTGIYGEGGNTFGLYNNVHASDTITGRTVWRTLQPFLGIRSVVIVNDNGVFKTLLITQDDWFMLE